MTDHNDFLNSNIGGVEEQENLETNSSYYLITYLSDSNLHDTDYVPVTTYMLLTAL